MCVITANLASLEVYAGQLIWPDYQHYPDVDTAFVHIAGRAGGVVLFSIVNLTLLVANVGLDSVRNLEQRACCSGWDATTPSPSASLVI